MTDMTGEQRAALNRLRNDAVQALTETIGLAAGGATPEQIRVGATFAVTAQAAYALALQTVHEEGAR